MPQRQRDEEGDGGVCVGKAVNQIQTLTAKQPPCSCTSRNTALSQSPFSFSTERERSHCTKSRTLKQPVCHFKPQPLTRSVQKSNARGILSYTEKSYEKKVQGDTPCLNPQFLVLLHRAETCILPRAQGFLAVLDFWPELEFWEIQSP